MTIAEAAAAVLGEKHLYRPLDAREIHARIIRRELYEFKAKDPVSSVSAVLRKGAQFERTAPGTFELRHK